MHITVDPNPRETDVRRGGATKRMTFTGLVGAACMYPLRAIINLCVRLRIHPNTLTLIGVIINVGAAWALAYGRFTLAFVIMLVANIFDFIDGKVAHIGVAGVGVNCSVHCIMAGSGPARNRCIVTYGHPRTQGADRPVA